MPTHVQVRYRIHGVLYDHLEIPSALLDEVVSRIKVIGRMDIAEKRLAQDGRATVRVGDKPIDPRIRVIPTSHGERVVLRLLDKSARLYRLPELGMSAGDQPRFERVIQRTHGIVLETGPTGSARNWKTRNKKLEGTLEDPIEHQPEAAQPRRLSGRTCRTGVQARRAVAPRSSRRPGMTPRRR